MAKVLQNAMPTPSATGPVFTAKECFWCRNQCPAAVPTNNKGQRKGDHMKVIIKLIGLAMLVGGGWVMYANRALPEDSNSNIIFYGFVVAAVGVVILIGWETVKGITKAIGNNF